MKSRVQRARDQLKEMLLRCCEVDVDRRRGVADYHLRESAACGTPSDGSASGGGCGISGCSPRRALHGRTREFGPNMGEFEFEATVADGVVTYDDISASGYKLTLAFVDGELIAAEEGFPPFGVGVYFAGQYRRA